MALLEVNNLSVSIGGKCLLEDINFFVNKGDYINIIGRNGAGKTTLLKTIIRLLPDFEGEIYVEGDNLRKYSPRLLSKKISYVPQFNSVKQFKGFTLFEYMLTGRFPYINKLEGYTKTDREKVDSIIKDLKLEEFKNNLLTTLSGGELQKVILGTALVQSAGIILLDEAETYLDIKHKIEFDKYLQKLLNEGETIIAVTHNINGIVQGHSKVLAVKNGRQLYFGSTSEFLRQDLMKEVYDVNFKKVRIPDSENSYYIPVK